MKTIKIISIFVISISSYAQSVTQAEYFWDNDPGQGNGITMLAFDGNFNQALESPVANNATLPPAGNHIIGIRIKGSDGNWSTVFRKVIRISENNNSNNSVRVTQAEYFWNSDPGEGNGNTMLAFDGNFNQAIENVIADNTAFPDLGLNVLHVRFKSDDGNWGTIFSKVVGVNIAYNEKVTLVSPINNAMNVPISDNFSWNLLTGVESYEYQCATDNNFNTLIQTGIINGNIASFTSLNPNTNYYWRVRAKVNDQVSLWSDIWNFTTSDNLSNVDFESSTHNILYPNPATNYIKLSSNEDNQYTRYTIYSSDGKLIMEGATYLNNQIDIEKLSSGNYIFNFSFENNQFNSIKFIKK